MLTAPAAAPAAAPLAAASEPIVPVAAPVVSVVSRPLDDVYVDDADYLSDANDDSIAAIASAPVVDLLLVELPSAGGYVSEPRPISAVTLYRAATAEYDLRPLSDDPAAYGQGDDLLVDVLAESALAIGL